MDGPNHFYIMAHLEILFATENNTGLRKIPDGLHIFVSSDDFD